MASLRPFDSVDAKMAEGIRRDIVQGKRRTFPEDARWTLADSVKALDVKAVPAGAQSDGALIVPHRVSR